jgi:hypothetical protein
MKRASEKRRGRPPLPEGEPVVTIYATVPSGFVETIEALSRARRWSRAKAAGYLIELGLVTVTENEEKGTVTI